MPRVQRTGNNAPTDIGNAPSAGAGNLFDFSSPSGWTMLYWILSILIIGAIYFSL